MIHSCHRNEFDQRSALRFRDRFSLITLENVIDRAPQLQTSLVYVFE